MLWAHNLAELSDYQCVPSSEQETHDFWSKQRWFYAVLLDKVTYYSGHTLVLTQADTSDARHVLWSLYHDATTSATGICNLRAMHKAISSLRLDSSWKKGQMEFLLTFHRQVQTYNEFNPDPATQFNDNLMKEFLRTAVHPAANLCKVSTHETEGMVSDGRPAYDYPRLFQCLEVSAQLHDDAHMPATTRTHAHVADSSMDPTTTIPDADPPDMEPLSRDVFAAATQRPCLDQPTFRKLSQQGKEAWFSLSDTDRTALASGTITVNTHMLDTLDDPSASATPDDATSTTPDPAPPDISRTAHKASASPPSPSTSLADAHPGDVRRLLSPQNAAKSSTKPARAAKTMVHSTSPSSGSRTVNMAKFDSAMQSYWDAQDPHPPSDFC